MQARALAAVATLTAAIAVAPLWWPAVATADSYTVREGETLGGIASRAGMSPSRLAALNGISNPDVIQPGQILTTSEPTKYIVRSGDTLSGIADKQGTSVSYLAALNGIAN